MSQLSQIAEVARGLCGGTVDSLEAIHGAGNHRVYRVDGDNGSRFALKTYFAGGTDGNTSAPAVTRPQQARAHRMCTCLKCHPVCADAAWAGTDARHTA